MVLAFAISILPELLLLPSIERVSNIAIPHRASITRALSQTTNKTAKMADMIPTNALRGIYANKPTASDTTNTHELNDLESQRSIDPNAAGQHTRGEFILGRTAIFAIIAVTVIIIVLIVVVVVKAGQVAKKNKAAKKAKQEADKAAGIVSSAFRNYAAGSSLLATLMVVLAQVLLL